MTDLLKELTDLHELMQDPAEWGEMGICSNLTDCHAFLKLAWKWPKHTGRNHFPVPGPGDWDPAEKYYTTFSIQEMWDREQSEYAALRWELLEWAIAQLEKANDD